MPNEPTDDRAPFAKALDLASRIIAAGASVGILAGGGYWLDHTLGLRFPLLLILGALMGSAAFGFQMWGVVKDLQAESSGSDKSR